MSWQSRCFKKGSLALDYGVMPLEGLWRTDDMSEFSVEDKSDWKWTLMIMQPDFVTKEMIDSAIAISEEPIRQNGKPPSGSPCNEARHSVCGGA